MYRLMGGIIYSIASTPVLAINFYPILGELGTVTNRLEKLCNWSPTLVGILRDNSKSLTNKFNVPDQIRTWMTKVSDPELLANLRLFPHQFVSVPTELIDPEQHKAERLVSEAHSDTYVNFRAFLDNLIKPEDSEIFAEVSCLLSLQDSPLSSMADPEEIEIDHGHDQTRPQVEKLVRTTERNRELKESQSLEIVQSYENIEADKIFQNPLNIRHVNKSPLTRLLRMGTGVCCYFQEKSR